MQCSPSADQGSIRLTSQGPLQVFKQVQRWYGYTRRSERFLLRVLFCVLVPRISSFVRTGASMVWAGFGLLYVLLYVYTAVASIGRVPLPAARVGESGLAYRYSIMARHLPHTWCLVSYCCCAIMLIVPNGVLAQEV